MWHSLRKRVGDGFTLVEVLVVIIIVGILAGVAIPVYLNQKTHAYHAVAATDGKAAASTLASGLFGMTSFGTTNGTIAVNATADPATVTITLGAGATSPAVLYAAMSPGSTASGITYANTTSWCLDIANNGSHAIYTETGISSTQTSCGTMPGVNVAPASISGGVLSSDATYYYQTFLSSGTLTVTGSLSIDALIIGGGGGSWNSGGGAGGVLYAPGTAVSTNSYAVSVGAADTSSSFNSLVGLAGGGSDANGGSGGGATAGMPTRSGTPGQGNDGGAAMAGYAGGGGAGAPGLPGNSPGGVNSGGDGTAAYSSWGLVTGTGENVGGIVYYAGGGGGYWAGVGGKGGGATAFGRIAIANTGGGGAPGSGGASGIVIIRYLRSSVGG
jgi:prepilin-type N-terminal cleavage/methylation domain-containing protein